MCDDISKEENSFEITKEFLESQLNCKLDSFTVTSGTKPGENYWSVIYSIVAKTSPDGDTRHYLLKCYPVHPSRQKYLNKRNHFHNELAFYRILARDLVQFQTDSAQLAKDEVFYPAFPPCHAGSAVNFSSNGDPDEAAARLEKVYSPLDNFILMTDVRKSFGYRMEDRRISLNVEQVKLAFVELATMHALSWAYRKKVEWDLLGKYPFLDRSNNEKKANIWLGIFRKNVGTAIAAIDFVKGKGNVLSKSVVKFAKIDEIVMESFQDQTVQSELQLHKFAHKTGQIDETNYEPWRVVCHGDIWTNNMLYQYNDTTGKPQSVIFVDFPNAKIGCPTLDLACLVYTSTRSAFRHQHLDEVLQAYHDRFVQVCHKLKVELLPGFSMDTLKSRFQTAKLLGLYIALVSFPLDLIGKGKEVDLEKMKQDMSMGEMFQEACTFDVEGSVLFQEWMVECVQDLYNDGVIYCDDD